ncbi:MAG: glycoside hydrolase family 2 protein [Thermomicrobiales bacterium]
MSGSANTTTDAALHPRPQLTRARWRDLRGPWGFAYDDDNVGLRAGWFRQATPFQRTITVPFPPESAASGIGDTAFHPVVWYRRAVLVTPQDRQGRLLLHFGAVDYRARVWVNGQLVAEHEGGHTPFSADITTALTAGKEQVIVVRAEDQPEDLAQPRGKQDWLSEPHRIYYHRTTGIWQPVWLEPVPDTYIADVRWTPDAEQATLGVQVTLNAAPAAPLALRVRLSLRGAVLADDTYTVAGAEVARTIQLDLSAGMNRADMLWSPETPNLLDAELTLLDDATVLDTVRSYAGLRSAGTANGRFLLNGRAYYLRLALEQGYWPESHLAAPSDEALRREVELAKDLGFNGVRIHQKVEDPRFLYWCDHLGLIVWGEIANAFVFSDTAVERLMREWLDAIRRDYSHPCIVAWVPINESWGVPALLSDARQRHFVQALYSLTHALDPTRPVMGNEGWEHVASDVWGIHDYAQDGAILRARYGGQEAAAALQAQPAGRKLVLGDQQHRGEPLMLTEYGGVSYAPGQAGAWGYSSVGSPEARLARCTELTTAVLASPIFAGFCYTQLTDTLQETNGLLTADRQPKLDPAAIRAVVTGRPGW